MRVWGCSVPTGYRSKALEGVRERFLGWVRCDCPLALFEALTEPYSASDGCGGVLAGAHESLQGHAERRYDRLAGGQPASGGERASESH